MTILAAIGQAAPFLSTHSISKSRNSGPALSRHFWAIARQQRLCLVGLNCTHENTRKNSARRQPASSGVAGAGLRTAN